MTDSLSSQYGVRISPWGDRIHYIPGDVSLDPLFPSTGVSWSNELEAIKRMVTKNSLVIDME